MTADKHALCGDCDNGWITDEDGALIERCPCRHREPTAGSVAAEVVECSDWLAEWERSHE